MFVQALNNTSHEPEKVKRECVGRGPGTCLKIVEQGTSEHHKPDRRNAIREGSVYETRKKKFANACH